MNMIKDSDTNKNTHKRIEIISNSVMDSTTIKGTIDMVITISRVVARDSIGRDMRYYVVISKYKSSNKIVGMHKLDTSLAIALDSYRQQVEYFTGLIGTLEETLNEKKEETSTIVDNILKNVERKLAARQAEQDS